MSDETERNKAVVRRVFEDILPAKELSAETAASVVDPAFLDHDGPDANLVGPASLLATHAMLHARWPAVRFTILEMIAERDLVALRWTAGPTTAMAWFRVKAGKLAERWAILRHR